MPDTTTERRGRGRRLAWFFGLAALSTAATAALAYALRALLYL